MAFRRHFIPDFPNYSVRTDPESHAYDAQERFPQKTFHPSRTVGLNHLVFGVRQQRKIQLMFDLELRLRFHIVPAASQDGGVQLLELLDCVTKLGRFVDSTRSIRFGVKVEDQIPSAVIRQRNGLSVVRCYRKIRSFVAFFQHVGLFPLFLHLKIPLALASECRSLLVDLLAPAFPSSLGLRKT